MNFQCKNCGGNMVFSPKKQKMYCPYCDGEDCHVKAGDRSITVCPSCGGELTVGEFDSSSRCPYCSNYLVFDERIENEYKPDTIIPFKLEKEDAVAAMEKEFRKRIFTPASFLSEKTLDSMKGYYVPFFLYDFDAHVNYKGRGKKIRTWRQGNYDYTETSIYDVFRTLDAKYDNIPVDASLAMPNEEMDLLEPYNYKELLSFEPEYLAGFFGEIYSEDKYSLRGRAEGKVKAFTTALINDSIKHYNTVETVENDLKLEDGKMDFTLFPVWLYNYKYKDKEYRFFVNGQNGKVIGETPVSAIKVIIYAITGGGLLFAGLDLLFRIMGVVLS